MGKASGGDRQNLGDVVGRFHVTAANHGGRAPITVPKGTRPPRTGRGTQRLLGDGRRGKAEGGDEPQGCASRRALGERQSRNYEGSRSFWRLGILRGDVLAGLSFWSPHPAQVPWLYGGHCNYLGARYRRQYSYFFRCLRCPAQAYSI